jgi:hypothetical protein
MVKLMLILCYGGEVACIIISPVSTKNSKIY